MINAKPNLEYILAKSLRKEALDENDILSMLSITEPEPLEDLFRAAQTVRNRFFGSKVFIYGFLYISTFCRNNCNFCNFRLSNRLSPRYRKTASQIVEAACRLAETGVHLIDLTTGEDPAYFMPEQSGSNRLAELVSAVKEKTGLPVMVSPGVVPDQSIRGMAEAGADWYACYQETHSRRLYRRLRPGQDFEHRMEKKRLAGRTGMLIEEGLLCGIDETPMDLAQSFLAMDALDADQVRVMGFVPQQGTPMENFPSADPCRELVVMAALRLAFPDRLLPASLDVNGLSGLKQRLNAGANVVTSIVPPGDGFSGVAHHSLDIEEARRTVSSVKTVLESCDLCPAKKEEYAAWVETRQKDRLNPLPSERVADRENKQIEDRNNKRIDAWIDNGNSTGIMRPSQRRTA